MTGVLEGTDRGEEGPDPRAVGGIGGHDLQRSIAAYRRNNDLVRVKVTFEKLLVLTPADGWEPLCGFLDRPVTAFEFSRSNARERFWAFRKMASRGVTGVSTRSEAKTCRSNFAAHTRSASACQGQQVALRLLNAFISNYVSRIRDGPRRLSIEQHAGKAD